MIFYLYSPLYRMYMIFYYPTFYLQPSKVCLVDPHRGKKEVIKEVKKKLTVS